MQTKPGDGPKIIGLIAAIVLLFVFAIYQFISANQSATPSPAPSASTSGPTNVQPASSTSNASGDASAPAAESGQVRIPDSEYDSDLPATATDAERIAFAQSTGTSQGDPFRLIIAPKKPPIQVVRNQNPSVPSGGVFGMGSNTDTRPQNSLVVKDLGHKQTLSYTITTAKIRVEGVVTGADGFAMLTEDGKTYFKRPGETLHGYRITRLSEDGIVAQKPQLLIAMQPEEEKKVIWHIGADSDVPILGKPQVIPTAPVATGATPTGTATPAANGTSVPTLTIAPSGNAGPAESHLPAMGNR